MDSTDLMVLDVDGFWPQSEGFIRSVQTFLSGLRVVLIEQFKTGELHREGIDVSVVAAFLQDLVAEAVHMHDDLHFGSQADL